MRLEKQAIVKEIKEKLEKSQYAFVASYRGLNVAGFTELRKQLAPENTKVQVVSNSFLKIASKQCGKEELSQFVEGPTALITGGDVARSAKIIKNFAKNNQALKILGGILDKMPLTPNNVEELAAIPSREILYSQLVGTLVAPMQQFVGVLHQKLASIIYVLKAIEDKKKAENK